MFFPTLLFQIDPFYPFHPNARVCIKSEARFSCTTQEAESWLEGISESFCLSVCLLTLPGGDQWLLSVCLSVCVSVDSYWRISLSVTVSLFDSLCVCWLLLEDIGDSVSLFVSLLTVTGFCMSVCWLLLEDINDCQFVCQFVCVFYVCWLLLEDISVCLLVCVSVDSCWRTSVTVSLSVSLFVCFSVFWLLVEYISELVCLSVCLCVLTLTWECD